jgi:homoserine dehydrogenase
MSEPLRIGIAGLGTVGSALAGVLADKRQFLADRCGREIAVTGISARSNKPRGVDLSRAEFFADPVQLAPISTFS